MEVAAIYCYWIGGVGVMRAQYASKRAPTWRQSTVSQNRTSFIVLSTTVHKILTQIRDYYKVGFRNFKIQIDIILLGLFLQWMSFLNKWGLTQGIGQINRATIIPYIYIVPKITSHVICTTSELLGDCVLIGLTRWLKPWQNNTTVNISAFKNNSEIDILLKWHRFTYWSKNMYYMIIIVDLHNRKCKIKSE